MRRHRGSLLFFAVVLCAFVLVFYVLFSEAIVKALQGGAR